MKLSKIIDIALPSTAFACMVALALAAIFSTYKAFESSAAAAGSNVMRSENGWELRRFENSEAICWQSGNGLSCIRRP